MVAALLSRRNFLRGQLNDPADGPAVVIGETCLARNRIYCRSCADACPSSALRYRPLAGGRADILVDSELCDGCGACAQACPASAVQINAEAIHV